MMTDIKQELSPREYFVEVATKCAIDIDSRHTVFIEKCYMDGFSSSQTASLIEMNEEAKNETL